jgi:hypothetical protein
MTSIAATYEASNNKLPGLDKESNRPPFGATREYVKKLGYLWHEQSEVFWNLFFNEAPERS